MIPVELLSTSMLPIALRVSRASVRGMMGPPVSAWSGLWREGPEIRGASSMEARPSSSSSTTDRATKASTTSWNDEWARVGLGAHKADAGVETLNRLLFVRRPSAAAGCVTPSLHELGESFRAAAWIDAFAVVRLLSAGARVVHAGSNRIRLRPTR